MIPLGWRSHREAAAKARRRAEIEGAVYLLILLAVLGGVVAVVAVVGR